MRFRTKQRPRGVLRASDQRRLTLMIAGFGFILVCFTVVRRPQFWNGLFPDETSSTTQAEPQQSTPADLGQPVEIHHDEFLAGANPSADAISVTARKVPLSASPAMPSIADSVIPRIPKDLLKSVRDDVIGVHSTESEAYFASMKMASKLSPAHLRDAPRGPYALFMDAPNGSRGVAWRIDGRLRQLSVVKARSNAFGVGSNMLYDAWITTPDSGDQLVHVVSMKADKSLGSLISPTNRERTVQFMGGDAPEVHFTGYFFKREGYASHQEEGLSVAPLFVSGSLNHVLKPAVVSTRADEITPYLGWLTVLIAAGIVFMIWSFTLSDVAHANTRTHQLTKLPAHASFEDVTSVTVGEALQKMQIDSA